MMQFSLTNISSRQFFQHKLLYTLSVSLAHLSQENILIRSLPRLTSSFLLDSEYKTFLNACSQTICFLSGLKYSAALPPTSFMDDVLLEITGQLLFIASKIGRPKPSYKEGHINALAF